jgi:hypothetical protein
VIRCADREHRFLDPKSPVSSRRNDFRSAWLAAAFIAVFYADAAPAEPAQNTVENERASQGSTGQDAQVSANDFTKPQNALELRSQFRDSSGTDTRTEREMELIRFTGRLPLDQDWKLAWFAQGQVRNKDTRSSNPSNWESEFGLGDSTFQAALIQTLSERWAYGIGARLVAPTAQDNLGSGKWQIMPGFGVRYSFTGLGADSYFVPQMRYAMSFAGDPSRRNISEPQIAPTLNIDLPDRWYLTLYPSNDIRINYGDPVPGQTGRLFLPADFAIGHHLNRKVQMSLEIGVPIIKEYPVYDFKAEFRIVIKN